MIAVTTTAPDVITVIAVIIGFLLTITAALVGVIFNELRKQVRDNTRHVEAVIATVGPLMWRLITVEDWLELHHGYHPPRDIGWVEETPMTTRKHAAP